MLGRGSAALAAAACTEHEIILSISSGHQVGLKALRAHVFPHAMPQPSAQAFERSAFCIAVQASPDQLNSVQHCQSMLRLWLSGMLEPGMRATVLELSKVGPECAAAAPYAVLIALFTPFCHVTVCKPGAPKASSCSCAVNV